MDLLFGRRKSPSEILRQHQRSLTKAQRELDRERTKLEQQEKKLIADIKKSAKNNQLGATKIMAKDLVRTRKHIQKFYQMRTQLQAVALKMQTLQSTQQMSEAMRGATKAMKLMNGRLNLPGIQKVMMEFEKENEVMDMKEEMMNDVMDDIMDDEMDEEEETDIIVQQVLDEIGINLDQSLVDAPNGIKAQSSSIKDPIAVGLSDEDSFRARFDNLKRE